MYFELAMLFYLTLVSLFGCALCWRATRDRRDKVRTAILDIGVNLSDLNDSAFRTGYSRKYFDELVASARTHYVTAMEAYMADEKRRAQASVNSAEKCILRAWKLVAPL